MLELLAYSAQKNTTTRRPERTKFVILKTSHAQLENSWLCMVSLVVHGIIGCAWYHWLCMVSLVVHGIIGCAWYHWLCMVSLVVHGIIGCAWYHWLYRWSILNDLVSTGVASSSACNAQVSPPGGNGTGTPHAAANLLSKLSFAGPHTPTTTWNTIKDSRKFYARSRV
jgi:hypothetical protein